MDHCETSEQWFEVKGFVKCLRSVIDKKEEVEAMLNQVLEEEGVSLTEDLDEGEILYGRGPIQY